ncbi:MAG: sodium/proton-translocating pyrophosphatase, partial [bacterium]|nr:sodium/proton-translocating pyrophosphatase [bacterium]
TVIIEGLAVGMKSVALPVLGVAFATIIAYHFAGLYGIAIASVGILAVLGINLSTDCYGPIVDNAAGISEMAGLEEEVRQRTEALDAVGNTTAATGKGFAIGSAALVALAWLSTYFETANLQMISLLDSKVIAGLFIGAGLSFLFCSLTLKAVSRGAQAVVEEVRRQFKEIPGIMEERVEPDYGRCIDLITKKSLKEMILPGILVILTPILVGVILGAEALGGVLAGSLITGFLLALLMANAGGAWDNAKKFIEAGNLGGKGSLSHKAAVIGDTVGDPFKDTAGPSLNILIKLVGIISLIFLPFFL